MNKSPVIALSPNFNEYGFVVECLDIYVPCETHSYNMSIAKEYKFKQTKLNYHHSYLLDDVTMQYLSTMSRNTLAVLETAYFSTFKYFRKTHIEAETEKDADDIELRFWLGKFFREHDEEYFRNSIMVLNNEPVYSFVINKHDMILLMPLCENHYGNTIDFKVHKSRIDFSDYDSFIKSLNNLSKMIKISKIDNKSWNPKYEQRMIAMKPHFENLEDVYDEIMKKGFNT